MVKMLLVMIPRNKANALMNEEIKDKIRVITYVFMWRQCPIIKFKDILQREFK